MTTTARTFVAFVCLGLVSGTSAASGQVARPPWYSRPHRAFTKAADAQRLVPPAGTVALVRPHWNPMIVPPLPDATNEQPTSSVSLLEAADDHRWEGAIIGGVTLGLLASMMSHGLCTQGGDSFSSCLDTTILALAVGAVPGLVVGGMLGSAIPKSVDAAALLPQARSPNTPRQPQRVTADVGDSWELGVALALGITVTVVALMIANADEPHEICEPSPGENCNGLGYALRSPTQLKGGFTLLRW